MNFIHPIISKSKIYQFYLDVLMFSKPMRNEMFQVIFSKSNDDHCLVLHWEAMIS